MIDHSSINHEALPAVAMYAMCFAIGIYATAKMQGRYRRARDRIEPPNLPILRLLLGICYAVTIAAGWLGFLSSRALLGFERLEWATPLNIFIASSILLLPLIILLTVRKVARARGDE